MITGEMTIANAASHARAQDIRSWWRRLLHLGGKPAPRLRLCESLTLGERRFVAVIEFEQSRFLVGGTAASLVLLASLGEKKSPQNPSVPRRDVSSELEPNLPPDKSDLDVARLDRDSEEML